MGLRHPHRSQERFLEEEERGLLSRAEQSVKLLRDAVDESLQAMHPPYQRGYTHTPSSTISSYRSATHSPILFPCG